MNTFKKLVFGLLLSGMAFTVACGDNTEKKPGDPCDKADACGADLKCVIKDEKDTKGKCAVACTEQNKGNKCTGDTKTCGDAMEHGKKKTDPKVKVCMAGSSAVVGTAAVGAACDTSGTADKTCVDTAVCHNAKCFQKCDTLGDTSADCTNAKSGTDGTTAAPKCAEEGGVKMCVAASSAVVGTAAVGAACDTSGTADKTCVDTAVCHNAKCFQKCDTLGDTSADCTNAKSGTDGTTAAPKCAEEGGVKMCVTP